MRKFWQQLATISQIFDQTIVIRERTDVSAKECILRCARAPLGGAQGLFYKEAVVQRHRTEETEPNADETENRKRKPCSIVAFKFGSLFFLRSSFSLKYWVAS